MISNLVDELVDYIESCSYIDVLERLKVEADIKTRYDSKLVDDVKSNIWKVINYDALRTSIFNDCCDVFELDDKERKELMDRLKND